MERKKILIIDDEADFTKLVKLNLEKTGMYDVKMENDSTRAIDAAKSFQPDLILLDVAMPGIDGSEVAYRIKNDSAISDIPLVFLTAIVTKEESSEYKDSIGGNPFIAKPVNVRELISCIERYIKK